MQRFRKHHNDQDDRWPKKVFTLLALATYILVGILQIAYLQPIAGGMSLTFQAQIAKAAAIALWAVVFCFFTCFGGARDYGEYEKKVGEKRRFAGKQSSAAQFAHKRKYRNTAIGFFMLIIGLIQLGNPLLPLLSLGDSGLNEFIQSNKDNNGAHSKNIIDATQLFYTMGGIHCYGIGFGAALLGTTWWGGACCAACGKRKNPSQERLPVEYKKPTA